MKNWIGRISIGVCGLIAFVIFSGMVQAQTYSDLWGKAGEKWTPQSRLPDFSHAGYHSGKKALPRVRVTANVKRFGAKGDGKTDDTEAFKNAIESTKSGAILIPAGRYILSDILWIKKPNIVLRGEGPFKTVLHFTKELEDVRPNMGDTSSGRPTSNYSWSGGFLWAKGSNRSNAISPIISEPKRGDQVIKLENAADLKVGQRIQIQMEDDSKKSLLAHLYSNDSGSTAKITKPIKVTFVSRVAAIKAEYIKLERPLRWDIRKSWKPTLMTFAPTVSEVGIEELGLSFPEKAYKGHFTERGMNGIAMTGVSDCWIKHVRISNCDSGIFVGGNFCTVDGLLLDGERKPMKGDTGHHGVTLGQDCLIQKFELQAKFIHDFTMSNRQSGNVVKNGKGKNLSFDHHKKAPYENLFCNIDVGEGSQIWRCGGGRDLGKHCGARGTFWCIRSEKEIKWPNSNFGPGSVNVVGVKTSSKSVKDLNGKWLENIPPDELYPKDLHAAQLQLRLRKSSKLRSR